LFQLSLSPKDAMSSAVAAIEDEKVSRPQEWIEHNDKATNGLAQKLNDNISQTYPARRVVIDRKAKRKDDGPLEILCAWVVEHQIGMSRPSPSLHCCRQWLM
jgi:acyl-CoA-dependent ceramide synthase